MAQTIIVVNSQSMFHNIFKSVVELARKWYVFDEVETIYDWIVVEAFCRITSQKVMHHVTAANHQRNDVYRCIYDDVGTQAEKTLMEIFHDNHLFFKQTNKPLKLLITYNEFIIVNTHAHL